MKTLEDNEKGYNHLFLQIFQLKNFLIAVGGGGSLFITLYSSKTAWERVIFIFYAWLIMILLWLLSILFIYRGQLIYRIISFIGIILKRIIPLAFIVGSLYLVLIPFDYRKTLGVLLLVPVTFFYLKGAKNLQKVPSPPVKRVTSKKTARSVKGTQLTDWVATETNNRQGTDYREINLDGKKLKTLEFKIKPSNDFWRAGFKITDVNGSILPLRNDNSLLFHVGSTEVKNIFGVTAYLNSVWLSYLNKAIDFDPRSLILIKFEVNERNLVKCFINGKEEFKLKGKLKSQILSKAYLAAWGDGNPYRVEFKDVNYELRT